MANWSVIANELIPHGYCLSWQPHLLWLHGVSDALTAASYYSIPVMLLVFVRRRQSLSAPGRPSGRPRSALDRIRQHVAPHGHGISD